VIIIANKSKKLSFRVTPTELKRIEQRAEKANLDISKYIRKMVLNKEVIVIEDLKPFVKELKSIGNNLNQAVTLAHMGKINNINIAPLSKEMTKIWQLLNLLTEKMRK
jgi:hypothetical protein